MGPHSAASFGAIGHGTVGVLLGLTVALAACGGADGQVSQPPGAPIAPDPAGDPGGDGSDDSYGSAIFVLDGTSHEFAIGQFGCARREAELSAGGDATDGSDGSFRVSLPMTIEEWDSRESHHVRFSTPGSRWEATGDIAIGDIERETPYAGPRVDDFEITGTTVSGTFWVVDREAFPTIPDSDFDEIELVAGTFEVTCNEW